jgi:hypothetical protein
MLQAGTKVEPPFAGKDESNSDWEIDDVQPGQTKTAKFTAPAPIKWYAGSPNLLR